MTVFHKWPHIDAYSPKKEIGEDEPYIVTEKLDGANVNIYFDLETRNFRYFTRNGENALTTFDGLTSALERFSGFLERMRTLDFEKEIPWVEAAKEVGRPITAISVYAELINDKVCRRIPYGKEPELKIFGFAFRYGQDRWIEAPFAMVMSMVWQIDGSLNKLVPIVCLDFGSRCIKALDKYDRTSALCEAHLEGWVFHPLYPNCFDDTFKIKTPEFSEIASRKKREAKYTKEEMDCIKKMQSDFKSYLTENRLLGIQSKNGLVKKSDIPKVTAMFVADAKEDFFKDFPNYTNPDLFAPEIVKKGLNVGNYPFVLVRDLANKNEQLA